LPNDSGIFIKKLIKFTMQKIISFQLVFLLLFVLSTSAQKSIQKTNAQFVKIETNLGMMVFKLSAETPKHTANFIKLAKKGYYNNYDFNRVIKGFVIQGGETDSAYAAMEKVGKVLQRIEPELNTSLFHQKGALAAGRDDNKEKTSFEGQFYVVDGKKYTDQQLDALEKRIGNGFHFSADARKIYKEVGGTPSLDQNYTIFGQMVKGFDVLDEIASTPKSKTDKPLVKVKIKVVVLSKKEVKALQL
jgi:cyclophilin family peptidyl-prolyl cis-trans isomerase